MNTKNSVTLAALRKELKKLGNPLRAEHSKRFFKTGPGQYGEGDIFLGITVPVQRIIAKKYVTLGVDDLKILLYSKIHEERLVALFILVQQFQKGDEKIRKAIYTFYLKNADQVNNWDLVDSSADRIVGEYLFDKPKDILYTFAKSKNIWRRRIAIIATFRFIKKGKLDETFRIAELLLNDTHDLIHKAVGWMLREAGKVSRPAEERFLKQYHAVMPRTMLRYAIELFPEEKRLRYLRGL